MVTPSCNQCGTTTWLLDKWEKRYYYSQITTGQNELRWIEEPKRKEQGGFRLVCSRCDREFSECNDEFDYTIEKNGKKVVFGSRLWERFVGDGEGENLPA